MVSKKRTIASVLTEFEAAVKAGDKIIASGAGLPADDAANIATLEKEYAELVEKQAYENLGKMPLPMEAAARQFSFPIKRKTEIKKDGKAVGLELKDTNKDIDLLKFCKQNKLNEDWDWEVSGLGYVLLVACSKGLGYSAADIINLNGTIAMRKEALEVLGENFDLTKDKIAISNRALVNRLQRVLNAMLQPEDENNPKYRIGNYDINFIKEAFTQLSRKACTISVAKQATLRRIMLNVLHSHVTGRRYTSDGYRVTKEKQVYVPQNIEPIIYEPSSDEELDTAWLEDLPQVA